MGGRELSRPQMRAVAPVVGVLVLLAITVGLGALVAVEVGTIDTGSGATIAAFDLTVDGDYGDIVIEHVSGDDIAVEELTLLVAVDGTNLESQPPVPFVGAPGFDGAPSGPINPSSEPVWTAGERVGFRVATTNDPGIERGDNIVVMVIVDGAEIARLEATAT